MSKWIDAGRLGLALLVVLILAQAVSGLDMSVAAAAVVCCVAIACKLDPRRTTAPGAFVSDLEAF